MRTPQNNCFVFTVYTFLCHEYSRFKGKQGLITGGESDLFTESKEPQTIKLSGYTIGALGGVQKCLISIPTNYVRSTLNDSSGCYANLKLLCTNAMQTCAFSLVFSLRQTY